MQLQIDIGEPDLLWAIKHLEIRAEEIDGHFDRVTSNDRLLGAVISAAKRKVKERKK